MERRVKSEERKCQMQCIKLSLRKQIPLFSFFFSLLAFHGSPLKEAVAAPLSGQSEIMPYSGDKQPRKLNYAAPTLPRFAPR